ncbi:hypothetical protein TAMA11512_12790 [Selenomonas sp. TAMA-11512]|nr:hypothetical protein TAMA11512_12790 [Selenomonas sp. TAMA-11512]
MTNLEWCELWSKYYAFLAIATRTGFFVPELKAMEEHLKKCRPERR